MNLSLWQKTWHSKCGQKGIFMTKLNDMYEISGSDFEGFKDAVTETGSMTKSLEVNSDKITLLHKVTSKKQKDAIAEKYGDKYSPYYIFTRESLEENNEEGKSFAAGLITNDTFPEELTRQMENTTLLAAKIGDEKYLISEHAMSTLCQRAKVSGFAFGSADLQRNAFLAHSLLSPDRKSGSKPQKINIIFREEEADGRKVRKIFAFLGRYYKFVPQTILISFAEEIMKGGDLGEPVVREWKINHERTYIYLEFPDAADEIQEAYKLPVKIIPGVILATSDIGENSIVARGVARQDKSDAYVITDEVSRKHSGDIDTDKVIEDVNNVIFANVRKLPEVLAELISRELMDYSSVDMTDEKVQEDNRAKVADAIKLAMKSVNGTLSARCRKQVEELLLEEINPARRYTWYDIAAMFLELPERIEGINKEGTAFLEFRRKAAKTPFFIKKQLEKAAKDEEQEEEIVLI